MNSNSMFFFVNLKSPPRENLMSQSMYVISPRRKKHPELTPVPPRDQRDGVRGDWLSTFTPNRSRESSSYKLGDNNSNNEVKPSGPKRAVSMTRLDQLAKPRQRYLEESLKLRSLASESRIRNGMSTSMTQLSNESYMVKASANNFHHHRMMMSASPCLPGDGCQLTSSSRALSKSMVSIGNPRLTPRETRLQRSRLAKGARSSFDDSSSSRTGPVSPTRPTSSMSGTSEQSTTSSLVVRRPKTTRKPRPVSIAGCVPDNRKLIDAQANCSSPLVNNNSKMTTSLTVTPTTSLQRPNRARSAGSKFRAPLDGIDSNKSDNNQVKPAPPRKPAHVKAAAAARRNARTPQQLQQQQPNQPQQETSNQGSNRCEKVSLDSQNNSKEVNKKQKSPDILEDKETTIYANKEESNKINSNISKLEEESEESTVATESETSMNQVNSMSSSTSSKKEISEEEYKKILAEKRRLAREQAEREAEAERQRQEKARREEEERQRAEEERMRAEEEEQMRLAEEHRRMQEEKLRQAMEEQRKREEEERKKREEEARLKAEREEQEAKAKEEAEKARLELEERLRKDEEERMLRKKRVEAIMSRTRKTQGNKANFPNSDGSRTPDSSDASPVRSIEESKGVSFNNQGIYLDVL